jgi:hypothetical protein
LLPEEKEFQVSWRQIGSSSGWMQGNSDQLHETTSNPDRMVGYHAWIMVSIYFVSVNTSLLWVSLFVYSMRFDCCFPVIFLSVVGRIPISELYIVHPL